jgi:hypothetical protein
MYVRAGRLSLNQYEHDGHAHDCSMHGPYLELCISHCRLIQAQVGCAKVKRNISSLRKRKNVSCEPVKRSPPICFNCSLQSQAREAGQPMAVEPVFRTRFCLVNCCCFGRAVCLVYIEKEPRRQYLTGPFGVRTSDRLQEDALLRAKDDSSFIRLGPEKTQISSR